MGTSPSPTCRGKKSFRSNRIILIVFINPNQHSAIAECWLGFYFETINLIFSRNYVKLSHIPAVTKALADKPADMASFSNIREVLRNDLRLRLDFLLKKLARILKLKTDILFLPNEKLKKAIPLSELTVTLHKFDLLRQSIQPIKFIRAGCFQAIEP